MSEPSLEPLEAEDWNEDEPDARTEPVDPELLARRRQFRSWVARGMGGLLLFTVVALIARSVGQTSTSADVRASASTPEQLPTALPAAQVALTPAAPPATVIARASETLRDVELPPIASEDGLARWSSLARSATAKESADVDLKLAKLVKTRSASIRDRARLARAILWRERGRGAQARAVFDDLARHATSHEVRAAARTNQAH